MIKSGKGPVLLFADVISKLMGLNLMFIAIASDWKYSKTIFRGVLWKRAVDHALPANIKLSVFSHAI